MIAGQGIVRNGAVRALQHCVVQRKWLQQRQRLQTLRSEEDIVQAALELHRNVGVGFVQGRIGTLELQPAQPIDKYSAAAIIQSATAIAVLMTKIEARKILDLLGMFVEAPMSHILISLL